jgi:hypothetical protein
LIDVSSAACKSVGSLTNLKELVLERNHDLGPKSIVASNVATAELLELILAQPPVSCA